MLESITGANRSSASRRVRCLTGLALLLAVLAPARVHAQALAATSDEPASSERLNEFSIWGGGSVASATMIGKWTDFDFGLLALRYARRLWGNDMLSVDWTVDGIPMALMSLRRGGTPGAQSGSRETVYGAGIAPIGLRLDYDALGWVRPYFQSNVGFLMFEDRLPASGTKFNYTWAFGVGTQLFVTDDQAITLGYDFLHISNAYAGHENPGFDSNILYAGYSFFR